MFEDNNEFVCLQQLFFVQLLLQTFYFLQRFNYLLLVHHGRLAAFILNFALSAFLPLFYSRRCFSLDSSLQSGDLRSETLIKRHVEMEVDPFDNVPFMP